jgi:hypothetical protein
VLVSPRLTTALDIKQAILLVDKLPALGFCPTLGGEYKSNYESEKLDDNHPKDENAVARVEANEVCNPLL